MFRPMRRYKQQLPREACLELLRREKRGVLSLLGDDGYPYGVPIDFWYCPEDGCLYFHCAGEGHKIDAMDRCDKVSFCVCSQGEAIEGDWALGFESVIVFGRLSRVEEPERIPAVLRGLTEKFTDDHAYIDREIRTHIHHVQCLVLRPEHITGKRVTES